MTPLPLLRVRDLTVRADGRELLASSSFEVNDGERVALVGPSGSGKSLFANLVLGFIGPDTPGLEISGSIELDGRELLGADPESNDGRIGAVFQLGTLGLFDDLSVAQNLRFGSPDAARRETVAQALGIDQVERPVTKCSGGEQVRVGLARTLLRGADVLLHDEPTTGLDPAAAARVVDAIEEAHRRLTLVITHDYATFADRVDAVLVLDPVSRRIERRPVAPATFEALAAAVRRPPPARTERQASPPFPARMLAGWRRLALATTDVFVDAASLVRLPQVLVGLAHPIDGPRTRHVLRRDLAPGVMSFVAISAVLVSFTGTWFLFERLPKRPYAEPLVQEDLLAGLGLIFTRVAIPLMVSVLLAAKLGAAAAAQLGHMQRTRQVDALHLLDIPVRRHLLLTTAAGQLAAALVATALAVFAAWITSMGVFLATHPGWSVRYFVAAWGQELEAVDVLWEAAKVGLSGLAVALVAYRTALAPKRVPGDVVKGIHRTLLRSLLLVLLIHAIFAFLEF